MKYLIIYLEIEHMLNFLSQNEKGDFLDLMIAYAKKQEDPVIENKNVLNVFNFIRGRLDTQFEKARVKAEIARKNGVGGGRPTDKKKPKKTQSKPKKTQSVINSFIAPTLEEVKNYCQERKNSVNPEKFFDYYSAGNWKDAKGNSVKNWKQKLLTWESKDPSPTQKDSLAAKLNSIAGGDYFKSITLGDKAILNCNVGMKTKLYSLPEEIRQKIKDEFKQPIEIN